MWLSCFLPWASAFLPLFTFPRSPHLFVWSQSPPLCWAFPSLCLWLRLVPSAATWMPSGYPRFNMSQIKLFSFPEAKFSLISEISFKTSWKPRDHSLFPYSSSPIYLPVVALSLHTAHFKASLNVSVPVWTVTF